MAAPVMSNDSIPLPEEVEHLGVPVVGAQWPAMMEDDGLRVLGAPVLVEDRHSVLRGNRAHLSLLNSGAQAPTSDIRDRLPDCVSARVLKQPWSMKCRKGCCGHAIGQSVHPD